MKLTKKLKLFEEFTQTKVDSTVNVNSTPTSDYQVSTQTAPIKNEIVSDVDSIIAKLQSLADNIEKEKVSENFEIIEEGAADALFSAELYMIPIIAAGLVAGAGVTAVVLTKRAITKRKIKSKFNKGVAKLKIEATKLQFQLQKEEDQERRKKIKKEIEKLEESAEAMDKALSEKYDEGSYKEYITALRADLKIKIAEVLLKSNVLSDSARKKVESSLKSSKETQEKLQTKAEEEKNKAEEIKNNASEEDLAKIEAEKKKIKDQIENPQEDKDEEDSEEVKKVKNKIKEYEDAIKELEAKKDKSSSDKVGILKAALNSEKKKLENI